MDRFIGKRVAVVGLSVEGLDSVHYFLKHKSTVICCDRRTERELGETLKTLQNLPVEYFFGPTYLSSIHKADIIIRTPGMNMETPELTTAKRNRKEVTSQTKIFFELCKAPIIGVTGTKGKGTTATLIYEMLKEDKKPAHLVGNIGVPPLSKVDDISPLDWVVAELSSFQLEDLTQSPHVAVVLKITQDHLKNFDPRATSFHKTLDHYINAKRNIVRYQNEKDIAILNADNEIAFSFRKDTKAKVLLFRRFGSDADAYVQNGEVFVKYHNKPVTVGKKDEVKLIGDHNLENIAAAALAARTAGVSIDSLRKVSQTFPGLPYRLADIGTVAGVRFINDSFSTTPETVIAAVQSFGSPIVIILGGSEKGSDFTQMGKVISESTVKKAIVVGQMTERIVRALGLAHYKGEVVTGLRTMHDIVDEAYRSAKPGDVVLLSPGCASFDMFTNYKERGNQFTYEVTHLSKTK